MFRTARGFLLAAPPAFLVALAAFLLVHPHAVESFSTYPFLVDTFGPGLNRRPVGRFAVTALLFFLIPYLITGLLLFFADLGVGAAAPLWREKRRKGSSPAPPPESRWGYGITSLVLSATLGASLHRVAHGGELPGGVNVAPIFIAMVPFAAVAGGLAVAGLLAVPRAVHARFAGPRSASIRSV